MTCLTWEEFGPEQPNMIGWPSRLSAILWLVGTETILTWADLMTRGWCGPSVCYLSVRPWALLCTSLSSMNSLVQFGPTWTPYVTVAGILDHGALGPIIYADHETLDKKLTTVALVQCNVWEERNNRACRGMSVDKFVCHIQNDILLQTGYSHQEHKVGRF